MSDTLREEPDHVPHRAHRCTIRRKRRGQMRLHEQGDCAECGARFVWVETPFKQWLPVR